jgi:hypothetical protein
MFIQFCSKTILVLSDNIFIFSFKLFLVHKLSSSFFNILSGISSHNFIVQLSVFTFSILSQTLFIFLFQCIELLLVSQGIKLLFHQNFSANLSTLSATI